MDKLEYDLHHTNNRPAETLGVELDVTDVKSPEQEQSEAIEFSKKILGVLDNKLKSHNSEHSKRIKLHQLKSVFCNGARTKSDPLSTSTESGLARVNLFLRMVAGKIDDLNLDISKKPSYNELVDITDYFRPSNEDFDKAKSDIETYDLDYHFEDIDELYIENDGSSSNLYFDY
jgi:hypothetical protein